MDPQLVRAVLAANSGGRGGGSHQSPTHLVTDPIHKVAHIIGGIIVAIIVIVILLILLPTIGSSQSAEKACAGPFNLFKNLGNDITNGIEGIGKGIGGIGGDIEHLF